MIVTLLYTSVSYYMIYKFSHEMGKFEFTPQLQMVEIFASQHTIMIRGINNKIGVDLANAMIRTVFEERFK